MKPRHALMVAALVLVVTLSVGPSRSLAASVSDPDGTAARHFQACLSALNQPTAEKRIEAMQSMMNYGGAGSMMDDHDSHHGGDGDDNDSGGFGCH